MMRMLGRILTRTFFETDHAARSRERLARHPLMAIVDSEAGLGSMARRGSMRLGVASGQRGKVAMLGSPAGGGCGMAVSRAM